MAGKQAPRTGYLHFRAKKADAEVALKADSPEGALADILIAGNMRKLGHLEHFPSDDMKAGDIVLDLRTGASHIDGGRKVFVGFPSICCPDCGKDTLTLQKNRLDNWSGKNPFVYMCSDDDCDGYCAATPNGATKGVPAPSAVRKGRSHTTDILNKLTGKVFREGWMPGLRNRGIDDKSSEWKRAYQSCIGHVRRWFAHEAEIKNIDSETDIDRLRAGYKLCLDADPSVVARWQKSDSDEKTSSAKDETPEWGEDLTGMASRAAAKAASPKPVNAAPPPDEGSEYDPFGFGM